MSSFRIVRQHSENASETSIWRELTASGDQTSLFLEKYENHDHAPDLGVAVTCSYGFSQTSRCNQTKPHTHISFHKQREPKRIQESRDINEKPPDLTI